MFCPACVYTPQAAKPVVVSRACTTTVAVAAVEAPDPLTSSQSYAFLSITHRSVCWHTVGLLLIHEAQYMYKSVVHPLDSFLSLLLEHLPRSRSFLRGITSDLVCMSLIDETLLLLSSCRQLGLGSRTHPECFRHSLIIRRPATAHTRLKFRAFCCRRPDSLHLISVFSRSACPPRKRRRD